MGDFSWPSGLPEQIERWPHADIRKWQTSRLREVVYQAREVPFYRDLWSAAGVPEFLTLDDFLRFPVISKRIVIAAGDTWHSSTPGRVAFSTRGTSGEPLLVWLTEQEAEVYIAPTMRGFRWAGFQALQTALLMSPVWHRLAACESHAIVRLGGHCAFFWGSLGIDNMNAFLETLVGVRPEFVTTTAPFLLALVRRFDELGQSLPDLFRSVRSIVVVGLPLTTYIREHLRDRLGVDDVFERSGTQEGAALDECRHHNTPHAHEDVCYLEVLDGAGRAALPGERGRLVVTKLTAAGSIFIRYDTGDIAAFSLGPCPCGCEFRRLKIFGRPESSVKVGSRVITAYDVRDFIERNPELIGRNILLVREHTPVLNVAIEGTSRHGEELARGLRDHFGIEDVRISWLGTLRVTWGFRQVVEPSEIGLEKR